MTGEKIQMFMGHVLQLLDMSHTICTTCGIDRSDFPVQRGKASGNASTIAEAVPETDS